MDIQQLRYFVSICRNLSFAKAAEECFVSSQGISMAIRRLEEYLSCKLFERSSKGISLTKHARYLLPIAVQIVEQMNTCEAYFASGQGKDQKLSVMFTRGIYQEFAQTPVMEFKRRHPDVYLEQRQGYDTDCEDALDASEIELALSAGPVDRDRYDAEFIHASRYGVVVHKDDPLAQRKALSIQELQGVPLTVMQERQKTLSVLTGAAGRAGVTLSIHTRVDNALLTYQYADLRQAAGISTRTLAPHFAGMNLRFVPFEDSALTWDVYILMRKGHMLSPAGQLLAQLIRQHRDNRLMDRRMDTD